MTRDDIIRMAREAGLTLRGHYDEPGSTPQELERFARLVYEATFRDANIAASKTILDAAVLEEREACAKVCDGYADNKSHPMNFSINCADAIRARGNT